MQILNELIDGLIWLTAMGVFLSMIIVVGQTLCFFIKD